MSLESVWKHALNEDTGKLITDLYRLAPSALARVIDAAQHLDDEAQEVLSATERAEASRS